MLLIAPVGNRNNADSPKYQNFNVPNNRETMIHEWILNNGICITYHSELKWIQIDTHEESEIKQLPSVRIKKVTNSIEHSKDSGNYYWNDYSRYYTEGNFESKGQPFSFYMERNEQFQKVYENTKHIEYLKDIGFDLVYLRDRRYRDRMQRIEWTNYTNTQNIKSYNKLNNSIDADLKYKKSWTFLQRNSEHGCLLGCLSIVVIGIGIILLFSILGLTQ